MKTGKAVLMPAVLLAVPVLAQAPPSYSPAHLDQFDRGAGTQVLAASTGVCTQCSSTMSAGGGLGSTGATTFIRMLASGDLHRRSMCQRNMSRTSAHRTSALRH